MSARTLGFLAIGLLITGSAACIADSQSRFGSASTSGGNGAGGGDLATVGNGSSSGGGDLFTSSSSTGAGNDDCDNILEMTVRDFTEAHVDFEMGFSGDVVRLELVEDQLGSDQRPVFKDGIGCPPDSNNPMECANWTPQTPVIASAASFHEWYHSVDGVNMTFDKTITLDEDPPDSGNYVFDSTSFFPLGDSEGFGPSPMVNNPNGKNFLFTTEIHVNFEYKPGQVFSFRGDDDLWIFVNGRLALDLGSLHSPEAGSIDFDAQAQTLGITPGKSYPMDIFQAERHTSGSNFRFETNISCFTPVDVPK